MGAFGNFIKHHYHWLVFLLLEIASLVLLCQYNSYQNAAWTTTANTVAGQLRSVEATVEHFYNLSQVNEQLTSHNLYLEYKVKTLAEQLEKSNGNAIDAMDSLLAQRLADYRLMPAKVVSNSIGERDNLLTIDKGRADGVREEMGVVSGNGVVGIVLLVGNHYSIVLPALSPQSNISCMIEDRGYSGTLNWTGGARNMAYVDGIPRHAHFRLYERVVTSGYSAIFPQGIPVGKILHVFNSRDGIAYRLQVQLYTDFSRLRDVCVVDNSAVKERLELMRAARDTLQLDKKNNF